MTFFFSLMGKAKSSLVCLLNSHFGPESHFIVHRADSIVFVGLFLKQADNDFLADFNIKYLDFERKMCS